MTAPPPGRPTRWLHADTVSQPSPIAGTGWFATGPIAAGAAVSRLDREPVSGGEAWLGNHSCEPNLWWDGSLTLVARRDIATGEELTHDYSTSTADPSFRLACHCETYRCRGLVTGEDWLIPQLQLLYSGHWLPSLQRQIGEPATDR